jgi:hypothetical protein
MSRNPSRFALTDPPGETHIAAHIETWWCERCGKKPARVYLPRQLLCGVCWHRILLYREALQQDDGHAIV